MTRTGRTLLLVTLGIVLALPAAAAGALPAALAGATPSVGAAPGPPAAARSVPTRAAPPVDLSAAGPAVVSTLRRATASGPCAGGSGVTVVVDFQELGGGVQTRCAPGQPSSGLDALTRAGVAFDGTIRFPGFVCRIAGRPAQDRCIDTSPASAYWSYWIADRGGSWCYSTTGAASRQPPEGTVEGWSFSLNRPSNQPPPPRGSLPPAAAGGGRLPPGDCNVAITPPPTPAPPPQPAPRPTPVPGPSSGPSAPAPPQLAPAPVEPGAPAPGGASTGPGTTGSPSPDTDGAGPATAGDGAAGADDGDGGSDEGGGDGSDNQPEPETDAEVAGAQLDAESSEPDEELAGSLQRPDDDAGGATLGLVAGLALIGGLGGAAAHRARRRGRTPA